MWTLLTSLVHAAHSHFCSALMPFAPGLSKIHAILLSPVNKIFSVLKSKLESDAPLTISVGLDAWSAHHHGYLGVNGHYLNENFDRIIFCLGCTPFDVSHTAANIYEKISRLLDEWDLLHKTGLCLRDNAANMVACFELEYSCLKSAGCVNHTIQLGTAIHFCPVQCY